MENERESKGRDGDSRVGARLSECVWFAIIYVIIPKTPIKVKWRKEEWAKLGESEQHQRPPLLHLSSLSSSPSLIFLTLFFLHFSRRFFSWRNEEEASHDTSITRRSCTPHLFFFIFFLPPFSCSLSLHLLESSKHFLQNLNKKEENADLSNSRLILSLLSFSPDRFLFIPCSSPGTE